MQDENWNVISGRRGSLPARCQQKLAVKIEIEACKIAKDGPGVADEAGVHTGVSEM